ncbi:hypothetical protein LTR15_009273 [Elasticomyces elasticus]|nr:hypothetical protein LTR15_009273 [Elasticomyces elasticus]
MEQQQSQPLRLIDVRTLRLRRINDQALPYAILSHTWGEDEISLQEWDSGTPAAKLREGYSKIVDACRQAKRDRYRWLWADSVCIDKTNSSEMAESIQCMYAWYHNAEICYALLSDVDGASDKERTETGYCPSRLSPERVQQFRRSRWFKRGWTLQELIAPRRIVFYSKDWTVFDDLLDKLPTVSEITNIPETVLRHEKKLNDCTFAQRLSWASGRETKRIEDQAYSLLGILDVIMPPLYGEGSKAFLRLQKVLLSEEGGMTVLAWDSHDLTQSACLLAPSLACFRESGDIEAELSSLTTAEYSFTNIGLSGYFPVILRPTTADEHMFIPLHCYRKRKPHETLALSLSAAHTNSGRGGSVECRVSPTVYSSAGRTSNTRLAVVNPSQQSLMINITIRSSPTDIARISRGINHVIERSSGDRALKPPRHGSGEALLLPAAMIPNDESTAIKRFADGSDRFAGDLYKAIGHSLVAFIGAAMSGTTTSDIDMDEHLGFASSAAMGSRNTLPQPLQSFLSDQMGAERFKSGLQTATMTKLRDEDAFHSPVFDAVVLSGVSAGQEETVVNESGAAFAHQPQSYVRIAAPNSARTVPILSAEHERSGTELTQSYNKRGSATTSCHIPSSTDKGGSIGPPTTAPSQPSHLEFNLVEPTCPSPTDRTMPVIARDPESGVTRTAVIDSPQQLTEATLLSDISHEIKPTAPRYDTTELFPSFRLPSRNFFKVGRVFLALWSEPAGESSPINGPNYNVLGKYGDLPAQQATFSKVRRLVVVREAEHFCSALPITHHGSRGVSKMGTPKLKHSIIHTGRQLPQPTPGEGSSHGENGMRPRAIRVDLDNTSDELHPMSRLDYGKAYIIHHNVKVAPVGVVHPDSMLALLTQFQIFGTSQWAKVHTCTQTCPQAR